MVNGLSRSGRYNDLSALLVALTFLLVLLVRGVGAPVNLNMDGPLAACGNDSCAVVERIT